VMQYIQRCESEGLARETREERVVQFYQSENQRE
jgi:hypothetical protein